LEKNSKITLLHDFFEAKINSVQRVFLSESPLENFPLNVLYAPKILFVGLRHCHINSNGFQSLLKNSRLYELILQSRSLNPLRIVEKFPSLTPKLDLSQNNITKISFKNALDVNVVRLLAFSKRLYLNLTDNPIDCICSWSLLYIHGINIDWKC
jgi:hypothetical protein